MKRVKPDVVGLSSSRLERINAFMRRNVEQQKIAGGITLLARHGQVAHFECSGLRDVEAGKPMQPDTIFRIYSMTKPVTSVAAMMLYEEGFFLLDDPVADYIPEFKETPVFVGGDENDMELAAQEQPLTIRHLLTHTSGLVYGNPEGSPVEKFVWQKDREHEAITAEESLAEWIPRLVKLPLANQPGQAWQYGVSTDVVGYLVEVISAQPFDTFLTERIFDPLGMADSGFHVPPEKLDRFAAMYGPAEKGGLELIEAPDNGPFARPRRFFSGGGGLVSTASDYLRFDQMLLNQGVLEGVRLLSRKTVELMTGNHLPPGLHPWDDPVFGFGLGGSIVSDVARGGRLGSVGTFSWGGAASTDQWVDPNEDLIGMFLIQYMPYYERVIQEYRVLAYQAVDD